jgi:hypothetical protein
MCLFAQVPGSLHIFASDMAQCPNQRFGPHIPTEWLQGGAQPVDFGGGIKKIALVAKTAVRRSECRPGAQAPRTKILKSFGWQIVFWHRISPDVTAKGSLTTGLGRHRRPLIVVIAFSPL